MAKKFLECEVEAFKEGLPFLRPQLNIFINYFCRLEFENSKELKIKYSKAFNE